MNFQFTDPWWLLALPVAWAWIGWVAWKSDAQLSPWRRWVALALRWVVTSLAVLALAGCEWLSPREGMNVFYLLDRSDSVPSAQQEGMLKYVNSTAKKKKKEDRAGVIVFGSGASIESSAIMAVDLPKINAVVPSERTDISAAIRLGTAAFPETGQKRLVLVTDGNENIGDAMSALMAAKPLGVTLDVLPVGVARGGDVVIQKLGVPNHLKKGQTFEVKIFAQSDRDRAGTIRLYRNDRILGEQKVQLSAGKNLFTFPQTLTEPGFYPYDVQLDVPGDPIPQNNRASSFTYVRGNPRVLIISADPAADAPLAEALRASQLEVKIGNMQSLPSSLAEIQSFDALLLSNISAGDMGRDIMLFLESAVRDFGMGLVCIGGDQAYAAGGYRGTPLEAALPVDNELNSKKVLPSGALAIAVHATEYLGGNQWARDIAFAALDVLGPQDEMGIVLWDGSNRWLFPLEKVGDKKEKGQAIAGMMPGDMPNFQPIMEAANDALKKSTANLKHLVVFSDGDPGPPTQALVDDIVANKITITTVMIGGHVVPQTMQWMADQGRGRFYDVNSPGQLPQIFIKEAAVILRSAIFEAPFKPRLAGGTEPTRGIGADEYPLLRGYVVTNPKARAEVPLVTDKGDPLLAHWQYGLGRTVAFTSDAKAKWAAQWMNWEKYRQFWTQVTLWTLRRIDTADFTSEVSVDRGEGHLSVEAVDPQGGYRNFLNLEAAVVSPKGERKTVRLEQTSPGRYETTFPTREVGTYLVNLMDIQNGQLRASQFLGASVNYSPEFDAGEPNVNLLRRLADAGGGKMLDPANPAEHPFSHNRVKTFQPFALWEWMLELAVILFVLDVGARRIQIDRAEWLKATRTLRRYVFFWKGEGRPAESEEAMAALLVRRAQVRSTTTAPAEPRPELYQSATAEVTPLPGKTEAKKAFPLAGAGAGEAPVAPAEKKPESGDKGSTASRLLAAKRKAQKDKLRPQ